MQLKPIHEQVIAVTGASSGIGLATVQAAAERGAKLVLIARSDATLERIVGRLDEAGCDAIHVAADVANREELQLAAQAAVARFGRIDTWVNDAGVSIYGRLDAVGERDSRRMFDINFWGVVNGSLVALPYLREQGGALVNVGSEVSDAVVPLQGMYAASKHAVKGFTDALRVEVEQLDKAPVSITLIQPTAVDTPFPQHARNYTDKEPKLPTPRIDPHQVAHAILHAAVHGGRDVTVGMMAKLNVATSKLVPGLADRYAARQADRQHYDQAPADPQGTLYRGGGQGEIHGHRPGA